MTSDYTILFSATGYKSLKKLPKHIKKPLREKMKILKSNPLAGEKLTGALSMFRSFHARLKNSDYRVAYQVMSKTSETVVYYVSSRENFYKKLARLRLKSAKVV